MSRLAGPPEPKKIIQGGHESPGPLPGCCAALEEALAFLAPQLPGLAPDEPAVLGNLEGIHGVESLPLRWDA